MPIVPSAVVSQSLRRVFPAAPAIATTSWYLREVASASMTSVVNVGIRCAGRCSHVRDAVSHHRERGHSRRGPGQTPS